MTRYKEVGGLGLRELHSFNKALPTKMAARVLDEPTSIWVRVLKGIISHEVSSLRQRRGVGCLGDGRTC